MWWQCAYQSWLYAGGLSLLLSIIVRRYLHNVPLYQFPLVSRLLQVHSLQTSAPVYILYALRLITLVLMVMLLGKPQLVDRKSKVMVAGIDIMLVLDISASMNSFDDLKDRRTRVTIAKQEAVRFVEKRHNDAVGLVIFGAYAMMRCPLTPDKVMLESMIEGIKMNPQDPMHDGTVISQAVMTAATHLQKSKSATKIMILLTDGEPSHHDFAPEQAIALAQAFGIKIYTIGIGNHGTSMQEHPLFGVIQMQHNFDTKLLERFAHETGGKFFDAKKSQDLALIYDEIDKLEKTQFQDNVYTKYHDYFLPLVWIVLILVALERILSTFVWVIV